MNIQNIVMFIAGFLMLLYHGCKLFNHNFSNILYSDGTQLQSLQTWSESVVQNDCRRTVFVFFIILRFLTSSVFFLLLFFFLFVSWFTKSYLPAFFAIYLHVAVWCDDALQIVLRFYKMYVHTKLAWSCHIQHSTVRTVHPFETLKQNMYEVGIVCVQSHRLTHSTTVHVEISKDMRTWARLFETLFKTMNNVSIRAIRLF